MYSIYFSNNDDLIESDIMEKGWRGDILVKIDNLFFHPMVITLERLTKEFNDAINANRIYEIEPNLILVKETNRETIIDTLLSLIIDGYFSNVKPVNLEKFLLDYDKHLQSVEAWVKVY